MLGGEIEQHDQPLARHDIAQAVRVVVTDLFQQAIGGVRNVDRERRDAELVDDELRVLETFWTRRAIRHPHTDDVVLAERLGREEGGQGGVHATRETDQPFWESPAAHDLVFQETDQPLPRQLGVDDEGVALWGSLRDDVDVRGAWRVVRGTAVGGGIEPYFLILPVAAQALGEHR